MILRCLLLLVIFILLVNDSIKLRTKEICLKEKMYSYLCYFMIVFVTFYMMGVLGSGYHFVDDHEFVRYNKSLVSNGLIHTLCSAVKNDMLIRFRFTYIIIRVFESYLFPNYMVLHILQTFLVVQSLYLSYVLARKCGSSRWLSVVFSLVIYIGPQAEVWWRLGPQENWGVLFFMMTLLSIIRYMNTKRSGDFFLTVVFVFFLGGIKESFLVLLPALPLFMLWYSMRTDGGNITWIPVKKLVLEYKYFIGWIGVVFCLDISFILCVVGTNKIGYAGIDSQFDLSNYISNVLSICTETLRDYVIITLCLFAVIMIPLVCVAIKQKRYNILIYWTLEALIFLFIFATQLVLHAKSGIFLRYYIPTTLGFGLLWIIFLSNEVCHNKKIYHIYSLLIIIAMSKIILSSDVWEKGIFYANDGKNSEAVMKEIASYAECEPSVVSAMVGELDFSLSVYLQEVYNIETVYNAYCTGIDNGRASDAYILSDNEKKSIEFTEADIIATYEGNDEWQNLLDTLCVNMDEYIRKDFGRYYLFVRKNLADWD